MKRAEAIEHPGMVDTISGDRIRVHLLAPPACGSCHAKSACGISESEEKTVEVRQPGMGFSEGDHVMVVLTKTLGFKALSLGYIFPLLLLLASVFVFSYFLNSEAYGAFISIFMVGLYYLVLFLSRKKIDTQFTFSIRKLAKTNP